MSHRKTIHKKEVASRINNDILMIQTDFLMLSLLETVMSLQHCGSTNLESSFYMCPLQCSLKKMLNHKMLCPDVTIVRFSPLSLVFLGEGIFLLDPKDIILFPLSTYNQAPGVNMGAQH